MAHGRLPWRIKVSDRDGADYPDVEICDADGNLVANNVEFYPQEITKDNAELIVRAVNAHADLVAALNGLLGAALLEKVEAKHGTAVAKARAASARAEA